MLAARSPAFVLRLYFFVGFGAMGLYLPHFANWLSGHGFVGVRMSALVALVPLMALLSPPTLGILADRFGLRGQLMTVCAATTATGLSILAVLAWKFESLPFFPTFLAMLVFAALRAPALGLADVVAMETSDNYGRMRLWGSLGFLTSAGLGSYVVGASHPYALPLAIAACVWVQALVSRALPRGRRLPPKPALEDAQRLLKQPGFRRLLITIALIFSSYTAYDLCLSLRLKSLGADDQEVGLFWATATLAEVALMYWLAPTLKRIGPARLLAAACGVACLRWLYLSQATDRTQMLWLQPMHAISFGMMWLSAIATLKREAGENGTATAQGLFAACVAIGGTLGMTTWGIVYDVYGSQTVFLSAAALSLLSVGFALSLIAPQASAHAPG